MHCVAPSGRSLARWDALGRRAAELLFSPVKPLSRKLFRRLFLERLRAAFDAKALGLLRRSSSHLADPSAFSRLVWPPRSASIGSFTPRSRLADPAQVLAYLGRYTHRVAVANSYRMAKTAMTIMSPLPWKDYRDGGARQDRNVFQKPDEFIRRFLLHALPDGFHRIRHFGFLANGHRTAKARPLSLRS